MKNCAKEKVSVSRYFRSGAGILSVFQYTVECSLTLADPGKGPGGAGLPLFFDQTEARRAKKLFLETAPLPPSYLRVWMTGPPTYLKVWIRQ